MWLSEQNVIKQSAVVVEQSKKEPTLFYGKTYEISEKYSAMMKPTQAKVGDIGKNQWERSFHYQATKSFVLLEVVRESSFSLIKNENFLID